MRIEIEPENDEEFDSVGMMEKFRAILKKEFPEHHEVGSGCYVGPTMDGEKTRKVVHGTIDFHLVHRDDMDEEERKIYEK